VPDRGYSTDATDPLVARFLADLDTMTNLCHESRSSAANMLTDAWQQCGCKDSLVDFADASASLATNG
jgi:hypothetical protein